LLAESLYKIKKSPELPDNVKYNDKNLLPATTGNATVSFYHTTLCKVRYMLLQKFVIFSACPSVTCVTCVELAKHIVKQSHDLVAPP